MKLVIVVAVALVAVAVAAPAPPAFEAVVLRSDYNQNPDGSFTHAFETSNGIAQQATGELKEVVDEERKPHTVVVQRGSYSFVTDDGAQITITYVADENGYKAEGDSIPKVAARR